MTNVLRIIAAEPVLNGVLKLSWNDGYEGIVDLRGIISEGEIFEAVRDPQNFPLVAVESHGHSIYWRDSSGDEIDFGCDRLRELAEQQAELLARAG